MSEKKQEKKQINLAQRLSLDIATGLLAGATVAPLITPFDVAVTSAQSGKQKAFHAVADQIKKMFLTPHKFFLDKPFLWIYTVYSCTYMANNTIDSLSKIYHINDIIPKLIGVTSVNMALSILKDAVIAKSFGNKPASKVPAITYLIWLIRDSLSISAAFIIPQRFANFLQKKNNVEKVKSEKFSQFFCPIFLQTVFVPIHLLGLDYYNIEKSSMRDRTKRVFKVYPSALPLRYFRMGSAFGVGGINNKSFRNSMISKYEGPNWDKNY